MTLISTPADVLLTPRRQRTRDRLLDAAYEVFAEQGVHASTVEEVCERAGFTRGAFYSNFTTKEELFAALMERQHSLQLAALALKVDRLRPRLEAVTGPIDEAGLGDLMLDFFTGPLDDRTWCLIDHEFRLMSLRDPEVAGAFAAHEEAFETSLLAIVGRALDLAGRRFVLPDGVAVRLLGDLYQDMLQRAIRAGRSLHEEPEARDTMVRLVLVLTRPVAAPDGGPGRRTDLHPAATDVPVRADATC
ncbi:TetR/AcrR family transcriptional regulator [Cellulomonas sp. NTE-D12]|uniref:TetR/AcrR family transcriptional regulator n=1 Tax=Cellulomonas sp. NTE-D12 TaxID=2962632 RepID=UPI003081426D|nr:putative TetR-family regulatory protein [Cellulomonas sp. NTE-D12]